MDAGMDHYLSKPVQIGQIAAALEKFIGCNRAVIASHRAEQGEAQGGSLPGPIDGPALLERFFGDLGFANSMLDELESTGRERVERIAEQAVRRDAAGTAREAHSLKGAAGLFCAYAVAGLAARIEEAGGASDLEQVQSLLQELSMEMQNCLESIPKLRQRLALPDAGEATPST